MRPLSLSRALLVTAALAGCLVPLAVPAPVRAGPDTGGAGFDDPSRSWGRPTAPRTVSRRGRADGRPVLMSFVTTPGRFFLYGPPARVRFRIRDRSRAVRVHLDVFSAGQRRLLRRIDLGNRRSGVGHTFRLAGRERDGLSQGRLKLRLSAHDPSGNRLRRAAPGGGVDYVDLYSHRFPLTGSWSYGGAGGRFGAARPGRRHNGQDLAAAEGTPVVAPRGGTVAHVAYQAAGAGHYVVLSGAGEQRDYVFMHMQTGSVAVRAGQRVLTGQRLGRVGSTGRSFGAHLHFEIWEAGPWYAGGHPVDPLPYLKRWEAWR